MTRDSAPLRAYDALTGGVARAVRSLSRVARAGGGTSVPGLVVQRLDPGLVSRRARRLADGIAVVSGTNGKTTTAAMLRQILGWEGRAVISNESGANLFRGIATAFVMAPSDTSMAVFEVDEQALRRLVPMLRPRVLVLTNVFRDQLDRFGEPETVASLMARAAERLPAGAKVVANADDPLLWASLDGLDRVGFSVLTEGRPAPAGTAGEPEVCPACGAGLAYSRRTIAHLGSARCRRCGWSSPEDPFSVRVVGRPGLDTMTLEVYGGALELHPGGIHNAYNAAAAIAAASVLGVPPGRAAKALEDFGPKFGRTEEIEFEGRRLFMLLMKNPAGANVLVDQVLGEPRIRTAVIMVSDRSADGTDISWIYDADFESLVENGTRIVAGGTRAADVAVRIKYAGGAAHAVESDPSLAFAAAVGATAPEEAIAVLATYTSMLDARNAVLRSRVDRVADVAA